MKTVLLTGPIGSGKSEAAKYLRTKGIAVYDCDSSLKALYENVPGLKSRLETELGLPFKDFHLLFGDKERLEKLETIVYPLLVEDILEWKSCNSSGDILFIESAIMLNKRQFDSLYDEVLMIDAPYDIRLQRNHKVAFRDALQSFDFSKINTVIVNDTSTQELYNKIDKYL